MQDLDRIGELLLRTLTLLSFHGAAQTLVVEFDLLIFGLELLLQVANVLLELFLALLMLTFERQNLIVGFCRLAPEAETLLVRRRGLILQFFDFNFLFFYSLFYVAFSGFKYLFLQVL